MYTHARHTYTLLPPISKIFVCFVGIFFFCFFFFERQQLYRIFILFALVSQAVNACLLHIQWGYNK